MLLRTCLLSVVVALAACTGEGDAPVVAAPVVAGEPSSALAPTPATSRGNTDGDPAPWPAPASGPPLPRAASPRFDEVAVLGTHNAYWVDRGAAGDLFGSGVGERLLDQLAFERVRSIELDIHRDAAQPGEFRVYHTRPGNSLCDALRDCLGELRAFAWAVPRHDPLLVIVELKQLQGSNFDDEHRIEDLDRLLRAELGPALFAPADLLARCPGETTLSACVHRAGWPGLVELRGRVLVALLGNWDELGAQATADWSRYAGGPIEERAAFPMASSWKLGADVPSPSSVTRAQIDQARAQSVLLQVEALSDPYLGPWLAAGAVVRANGAEGAAAQERRLGLGVQVLQTDTPWVRAREAGASVASLAAGPAPLVEPGRRWLLAAEAQEAVFAHQAGEGAFELAALVTSGRRQTVGCLRAVTDDEGESITLCRGKFPSTPGPNAERAYVELKTCRAGECETIRVLSQEPDRGGIGDVLALVGDANHCVTARSARTAQPGTLAPEFVDVGPQWCATAPLRRRGLFQPRGGGGRQVLFAGPGLVGPWTVEASAAGERRAAPERLIDASGA